MNEKEGLALKWKCFLPTYQTNKAITIYWKNKHNVEFIGFDVFSLGHDFQRIYIDRITKTATRLNEHDHTRNHFSRFNRIHKISKLNSQDFHCNESREFLFHFNECKKIIIVHFSFEWFRFIIQIDILAKKNLQQTAAHRERNDYFCG